MNLKFELAHKLFLQEFQFEKKQKILLLKPLEGGECEKKFEDLIKLKPRQVRRTLQEMKE